MTRAPRQTSAPLLPLLALLAACGGSTSEDSSTTSGGETAHTDPSNGAVVTRAPETELHAFVVSMCAEAARAMQDSTRPASVRIDELTAWGRTPARERMIAELGARSEALPSGSEIERAHMVLHDVAPDADCTALFRLRQLMDEGGAP